MTSVSINDAAKEESTIQATDLVMQLIVDEELLRQPGWSMGPMMAQAAHATSAVSAHDEPSDLRGFGSLCRFLTKDPRSDIRRS
jgi:hypothetical protein